LETKQNELETLRANIGTINKRFQKLRFMAIQTSPVADTIFPVIVFSLMLIFFSYDFGFIVAYEAVTTKSSWRSQSQDNPTQLLFSDGKRTLESNTNNSRTLVTFRDPDANVVLEQNLGSLGKDPLHRLNPKQVPQRR